MDFKKLWSVFCTFFKIGAFTFGGGYAMIPLIQKEAVENKNWVSDDDILEIIAIAESTPGPIAINSATFIGYKTCGVLGSVCATLGVVLPSFIIILIVAKCFEKFKQSKIVQGCMVGLKSAVVGLIAAAILSMAKTVFFPEGAISDNAVVSLVVFVLMLVLSIKKVHPILIVVLSAVIGILTGFIF